MDHSALRRLLDTTACQQPEYRSGLSNHLPMALHALAALGADDAALQRFAAAYVQRTGIETLGSEQPPLDAWQGARGQVQAYAALRATFVQRIARDGGRATVAASLRHLWPGVAGAAFHGVIRVAHAWEAGHEGELAAGLAYWAARWQPMPAPLAARTLPLAPWLSAAESAAATFGRGGEGRIVDRMVEATRTATFQDVAPRLAVEEDTLRHAAAWASLLYAQTRNFTILHVVTGLRAIHVLAQLDAPPPEVWNAVHAAVLTSGAMGRMPVRERGESWDALAMAARGAGDEHVIKLVHACWQFDARWPEPAFRLAAERALHIGP